MRRNVSISSILFYVGGLILMGLAISSVTRYFIQFIPYWVAGFVTIMPLYGKVKNSMHNVKIGYRKIIRTIVKTTVSSSSRVIVTITVAISLGVPLVSVMVRSLLLSIVGLSLAFIVWETIRAIVKIVKGIEFISFKEAFKSAL